ncbi:MAG TPA: penicillin-binding protein 2 [Nitrospirota bacterium]|nr:penicillin-binding protein 2 [Nitrospirota bacterium]
MYQEDGPSDIQKRLPLLAIYIILFTLALFLRLWYLQAVKGTYYYEQAESNRIRPVKLRPPRGIIYDRSGRPIVENVLTFDISLVPEDTTDLNATIDKLSAILKVSPESIRAALDDAAPVRTKYDPVKIREEAPWDEVALVEAHQEDLPGTIIEPEHRRHYPYNGLASHQLGYIGKVSPNQRKQEQPDVGLLIGQGGLEKIYDKLLRGIAGRRMIQVNAAGRKVKDLGIEEPRPGTDIYLTLDLDVQKAAEEGLGAHNGAVVAMDPNTGEILALASHPTYDPNLFPRGISPQDWLRLTNDPVHPLYNRAIQSVYPPGSTFKIIVALAGLESGIINPDEKITCRGSLKIGRRTFRCWKKDGHGLVSLHQAIVESCDVYFYTMGERIGWDRIAEYAKKLGYGSLTGILLPDEKPGLIPTTAWKKKRMGESWYAGDTYINSIGQGFVLVSPIQACEMMSAVANGGHLYRPILLKQTRNRETGVVKAFTSDRETNVALDPKALEEVRSALAGVVNEPGGTGHGAQTPLAIVGGKTGTSQVIAQKVPGRALAENARDHAWFVGFAPVDHPKIAVAVIVEHGVHGGSAAAPIARKVIEEYLKNAETKMVR